MTLNDSILFDNGIDRLDFATLPEAEAVMRALRDVLQHKKFVRVADLLQLVGEEYNHTHVKIGWYELTGFRVEGMTHGFSIYPSTPLGEIDFGSGTTDRKRVAFVVYVDLDPTPGTMHTEDSAQSVIRNVLNQRMPAYKPTVWVAPLSLQTEPQPEIPPRLGVFYNGQRVTGDDVVMTDAVSAYPTPDKENAS
jgi:hypothetical protein